jgi:hypothetical protein
MTYISHTTAHHGDPSVSAAKSLQVNICTNAARGGQHDHVEQHLGGPRPRV